MVCWLLGHRLNIKLRLHLTIDSEMPAEKKRTGVRNQAA